MFFESQQDKMRSLDKKIREITILMEKIDRDIETFFFENNINPIEVAERLSKLSKQENVTEEEWENYQEARRIVSEELKIDIETIENPEKAKKSYNDRFVQPHWLYVR
ncbi:MAG: hypothetical protein VX777_00680 [Chlamydiota bacterium]|nr:hypothetical protein [Chlamydiota bacterium]